MIANLAFRLFQINRKETGLVVTMGLILFLHSFTLQIANIVSISGFLEELGANAIVVLWVVEMIVIIITTGVHTLLVDRFERKQLLRWICILFGGLYLLLTLMFLVGLPGWLNYSVLSIYVDQQMYFFPILFWILANDMIQPSRAAKLFPVIASFGIIGDVAGLGVSAAAPQVLGAFGLPDTVLLMLIVAVFVLILVLAARLDPFEVREVQRQRETVRETLQEGVGFVQEVPSFRYLMLSVFAIAAVMTIIEYHFLAQSETAGSEIGSFQTFYSLVFLAQTLVAIVLNSVLTSRVIARLNLKNTFLLMPITTGLVIIAGIGLPGIVSATTGYLVAKLVLNGIDDTARKALQSFVPEERRGRVSLFIDSYLYAAGVILGSVLLGLVLVLTSLLSGVSSTIAYMLIGAVLSVVSVVWILRMRRVYDASLFNWRLKRRQRMSSVLDKLG